MDAARLDGQTETHDAVGSSAEITKQTDASQVEENQTLKRSNEEPVQSEPVTKKVKATPEPVPQLKKEEEKKSEIVIKKPIEEIIDGSDLRKFLNKNITPFLIKALDELSVYWQKGEYDDLDSKAILLKFSEIIKEYADKIQ
ncbi:hypothetical protein HII12_001023 [Brettanomyces bruxellensis]|uniref:Uncharacterized protein n=1 Tax=Dekkera bruxellensis TaxID=5007 RepID=A0A8H6BNL8_DEKBR|nr:hypothetical protein HII12_001023 [Brettanomyces bruxellensis]